MDVLESGWRTAAGALAPLAPDAVEPIAAALPLLERRLRALLAPVAVGPIAVNTYLHTVHIYCTYIHTRMLIIHSSIHLYIQTYMHALFMQILWRECGFE